MKNRLAQVFALLAIFSPLATAPAAAAQISGRPLAASNLVKPNVIFGLDDSGSMDLELMMYANDGALWWYVISGGNGWFVDADHPNPNLRTTTTVPFNRAGQVTWAVRRLLYLFPNGTGAGKRQFGDDASGSWAVMPTSQLAFVRWSGVYKDGGGTYRSAPSSPGAPGSASGSAMYNSLYYNPLVTYSPWAPAYISSGAFAPAPATASAARSHPVFGSDTFNLTLQRPRSTATDMGFVAAPSMLIPGGADIQTCDLMLASCTPWGPGPATDTLVPTDKLVKVAMDYFPATYWVKESCTLPSTPNVATDSCTTIGDGSVLKRYEIKPGNTFPSGRSYADELQNFANWFQYHRKRKLTLAGAMGQTLADLSGVYLGVAPFNNLPSAGVTMYDADNASSASNRLRVAGQIYEMSSLGGTPTRETLAYIGNQFRRTDATAGVFNVIRYSCQRNNAFILTDGFAEATSPAIPGWDSGTSDATWGASAPYGGNYTSSLSDLALRLYTNNPRPDLPTGRVRSNVLDSNDRLHVNTYALTLGARGTLYFDESSVPPAGLWDWPVPDQPRAPTAIDDLWHATLAGRGKMYMASTPEETALKIRTGLEHIASQTGSQSAPSFSAINLGQGFDFAFGTSYNTLDWSGNLVRYPLDSSLGWLNNSPSWYAGNLLSARAYTTRLIFSNTSSAGTDFTAATFGAAANPAPGTYSDAAVVDYLRGNRSGEGSTFRARGGLIGAVVNAEPVTATDDRVVFLPSGVGMLHAIDANTGDELWAYQPASTLAAVGQSVRPNWSFSSLMDATPVLEKLPSGTKLLVGGLGAGGRSFYALDVSNPRPTSIAAAAAQYKWTFPSDSDATNQGLMGFSSGKPLVVKVNASQAAVLVTSGYNNNQAIGDGLGRLWMLDANTGAVLKTFKTTAGTVANEAGLAQVSGFKGADGTTRYVYGGDLLGNVWRFDLQRAGAGPHNAELVATLKDSAGNAQPVTTAPELVQRMLDRILVVGTGRLLAPNDMGSTLTQSLYAFKDGATLTNARSGLVARSYDRLTDALSGPSLDWGGARGFYMDLPAGEQITTDPLLNVGNLSVVSNKASWSDCAQSSYLYQLDLETATRPQDATTVGITLSSGSMASRATQVRGTNGRMVTLVRRNDGTMFQQLEPAATPIPASKDSWKSIRR